MPALEGPWDFQKASVTTRRRCKTGITPAHAPDFPLRYNPLWRECRAITGTGMRVHLGLVADLPSVRASVQAALRMFMPSVFVSHCANYDNRSEVVLERLVRDLDDGEIQLVWDRDLLQVGDEWDDRLLEEIERCDGAILLLCEAALKRQYVVMECTLLAQRKRHSEKWGGNTFELMPVFIGDVCREDLTDPAKSHMTYLSLDKYQAGNDQDLGALVASLRRRLDRLKVACRRGTPRQELLNDISSQICSGKPNSDKKLARLLTMQLPTWIQSTSPEVRALVVATEMVDKKLRAVGRALAEAKDDLDQDSATAIVNRLAPFLVPSAAASLIPRVASGELTAQSLEVNAEHLLTARWYTRLAYGRMLREETAEVSGAEVGIGDTLLFEELVASIKDQVFADTLEEAKEELDSIGAPFFVLVPCPRPVVGVINRVREVFPTVTLVFLTGQGLPEPQHLDQVTLLEPRLEPQQEANAHRHYGKTISTVRRAHGG